MRVYFEATTVGGGYINGTAESVATQGLIWTLAPFGIFIGLTIGRLHANYFYVFLLFFKKKIVCTY